MVPVILKAWRLSKFALFCAVFIVPAGLGCLWVVVNGMTGLFMPGGGLFWMFSTLAAPWILLGASLYLLLNAGVRYGLHRAAREHRRTEKALGLKLPAPGFIREHALVGGLSLVLSLLVIAPRYLPNGVLIRESEEMANLPVHGSQRWENGQFIRDYAQQRFLHCTYITFNGLRWYNGPASHQFPACSYFYEE